MVCHLGEGAKFRVFDDFKASLANDILSTTDRATPGNLDAFLAMATYFSLIAMNPDLLASDSDFPHAYNHVGVPARHSGCATILIAPHEGSLRVVTLRTQPLGSARAPANRGRVTGFLQFAFGRLFGLTLFGYSGYFSAKHHLIFVARTIVS